MNLFKPNDRQRAAGGRCGAANVCKWGRDRSPSARAEAHHGHGCGPPTTCRTGSRAAWRLLHVAGQSAEAEAAYQQALELLLDAEPEQRAQLYLCLGQANIRRDQNVASEETVAYGRAYPSTIEAAGLAPALPAARFQLGILLLLHNDVDAAEPELSAAFALAEQTDDVSLEARADR